MIKFVHKDNNSTQITKTSEIVCEDIVREFFYFLLGMGYSITSVVDAFVGVSEEQGVFNEPKEQVTKSDSNE